MRNQKLPLLPLIIVSFLVLGGCSQPLPLEKRGYAGHWQGENMYLMITRDGNVVYERSGGNLEKSISGPLREFHGDDFEVGIPYLTTLFKVSKAPHQDNGIWKMTVDGVELIRIQE